jgi:hypothetical protein
MLKAASSMSPVRRCFDALGYLTEIVKDAGKPEVLDSNPGPID